MCKSFFDKIMCVSRKTCKVQSGKAMFEGIMIGVIAGSVGGIVLGLLANSEVGRNVREKMMCECIGKDCNTEECK